MNKKISYFIENSVISFIVIGLFFGAGWTNGTAVAVSDELSIGINTVAGEKGFEEDEAVLTSSVKDIFVRHEGQGEFINQAEGELYLSVSNPEVISVEENSQTKETIISGDVPAEKRISVYGQSEGAAYLYLNAVKDETITTLGKVQMEIR